MTQSDLITLFARFIRRINDVDVSQLCGLAEGTNATTIQTTRAIVYFLYNNQYTLAATNNIAMTACAVQAISTFCYYLVSRDATTTYITKGTNNTYALPTTPAGQVAIGAIKVVTDGVTTFTSGTTDLSAAGITATFYDIDCGIAAICINQAMRGMERKVNFGGMKVRTTYTLASATSAAFNNPIPLYKQLTESGGVYATIDWSDRYPMDKEDIDAVEGAFASTQTGSPKLIAEVPAIEATLTPDIVPNLQWLIRPIPDVTYIIVFTAYQYSPYLDGVINTTNWWTQNHEDVLLYAALVETAPYLKEDSRFATWKTILTEKFADLVKAEGEEEYSGSSRFGQGA